MKIFTISIISILLTGCIFSGGDMAQQDIGQGFSVDGISGGINTLVYTSQAAETGKILIETNLDSLFFNADYICGFSDSRYFTVERQSQNILWFSNQSEFLDWLKQNDINDCKLSVVSNSTL